MNTPILDFLKSYNNVTRLHMPGHKGTLSAYDVTEVDGADVLYNPHGIILESEKNASKLFGSAMTAYSVEGSSLCIRATVYLLSAYAKANGKDCVILCSRNVHSTFVSACAFADVNPEWILGDDYLSSGVTPEKLDEALSKTHATAFYLTSPDYLGNLTDMTGLAEICHSHGALFVVDNAHGAYLKFLEKSLHPLDFGADISVDSAHKTLPCLTGTAYIHVGKSAPEFFRDNLNDALASFASTSPSYLLLSSLDKFNGNADKFKSQLNEYAVAVEQGKYTLSEHGFTLVGNEPMKLTVSAKGYGYYGTEIADILKAKKIIVEFADKDYLTAMFSPSNGDDGLNAFVNELCALPRKTVVNERPPKPTISERVMSIREAFFSPSYKVDVKDAEGEILTGFTLSCPPAIPVAICGERLDKDAISALVYYGVSTVKIFRPMPNQERFDRLYEKMLTHV